MENLIPVLVVVGIVGFLLWKNKDKILSVADRFKSPPEAPKPAEAEPAKPVQESPPVTVQPKPVDKPEVSITERLFGITPEVAAYRDGLVEAGKDKFDPLEKLPKLIPGNILLGTQKHLQFLVTFGPTSKDFALAVPEGYKGSIYFDLTPHPNDPNGDAYCQFVVTDFGGKKVADVQGRLDQVKLNLSGKKAKGKVFVERGTYLAKITASKDCRTLFQLTEA